jgi:hypothetical protein
MLTGATHGNNAHNAWRRALDRKRIKKIPWLLPWINCGRKSESPGS